MKILHIENGRNLYGGPQQVLYLTNGLKGRGIINVVVCQPGSLLSIKLKESGIEVINLACRGEWDIFYLLRLVRVIQSEKPTVVDFWAEWCGPCLSIADSLEQISDEMKDNVVIAKHNIDQEPNTPTKYGIRGIPTMLLFKGGELKATKVGATTKSNIVSWIKENI